MKGGKSMAFDPTESWQLRLLIHDEEEMQFL